MIWSGRCCFWELNLVSNEILKDVFGSIEDGEKGFVDFGNLVKFDERF